MSSLSEHKKMLMAKERSSYLLNMLVKHYGLSNDDAYIWLIQSKTYALVMDIDGLFYYAPEIGLWDLLMCEYENRLEDWKMKIISY